MNEEALPRVGHNKRVREHDLVWVQLLGVVQDYHLVEYLVPQPVGPGPWRLWLLPWPGGRRVETGRRMAANEDGLQDGVGGVEDRSHVGEVADKGLCLGQVLLLKLVVGLEDLECGRLEGARPRLLVDAVGDVLDGHVKVEDIVLAIELRLGLQVHLLQINLLEEGVHPLAKSLELLRGARRLLEQLVHMGAQDALILPGRQVELRGVHNGLRIDFAVAVEAEELVAVIGSLLHLHLWLLVSHQLLKSLGSRQEERDGERLVGRVDDVDAASLVSAHLDEVEVDSLGDAILSLGSHERAALLDADRDCDVGEDVRLYGQRCCDFSLERHPLALSLPEVLEVLGRD